MTAAEARYIAERDQKEWYRYEVQNLMHEISDAANEGYMSVKAPKPITEPIAEHLRTLGFEVVNNERVKW